ncbi:MAG: hypothetical protein ACP5I1_01465, partial [Candidatus Hinthialibacter sp.]
MSTFHINRLDGVIGQMEIARVKKMSSRNFYVIYIISFYTLLFIILAGSSAAPPLYAQTSAGDLDAPGAFPSRLNVIPDPIT